MFSKPLINLTLSGRDADMVFKNIHGYTFGNKMDETFIATMRALLPNRMHDNNDRVTFTYKDICLSKESIQQFEADDIFMINAPNENGITLWCLNCGENGNDQIFDNLDSERSQRILEDRLGFRELKDLRYFLSRNMMARCFINEHTRSTVIVVSRPGYRDFHLIQSLIPRYLPWYFNDKPVQDDEKDLLRSLTKISSVDYERIIEEYAQKIDFREYKVKKMLVGFEKGLRQNQMNSIAVEIQSLEDLIDKNAREYTQIINSLNNKRVYEAGIRSLINDANDGSELIEYFMCNRNVTPVAVSGSTISIIVKGFIDSFDPEVYDRISNNPKSDIYRVISKDVFKTNKDLKLFFDNVMSDNPSLKVKVCAYYKLDMNGIVTSERMYDYPRDCADRIPNPHIQHYACIGNHKRYIESALRSGDTVRAIEQCLSSVKSINLTEVHTFVHFINDISNSNAMVVQLRDGTSLTPAQALEWLKQRKDEEINMEEGQNV